MFCQIWASSLVPARPVYLPVLAVIPNLTPATSLDVCPTGTCVQGLPAQGSLESSVVRPSNNRRCNEFLGDTSFAGSCSTGAPLTRALVISIPSKYQGELGGAVSLTMMGSQSRSLHVFSNKTQIEQAIQELMCSGCLTS